MGGWHLMSEENFRSSCRLESDYDDNRLVLLVRDPHCIYAYWDMSDDIRDKFIENFGLDVWNKSTQTVRVNNVSRNTSFFADGNVSEDSTYITVPDSGSLYYVELGRMLADNFFISILKSNYVVTPMESISSNHKAFFADFRNLKEGCFEMDVDNYYYEPNDTCGINTHSSSSGLSSMQFFGSSSNCLGQGFYYYLGEEGNNIV
jgi:hypothetical protein